jgi:hypothetical protein
MNLSSYGATSAELSLVITRADGTVEDLGVVSKWHKNPIKRFAWRTTRFLKGLANQ